MNMRRRRLPLLTAIAGIAVVRSPIALAQYLVQNADVAVGIDARLESPVSLTAIDDRVTGHEYVHAPTFLFEYAQNGLASHRSDDDLSVTEISPLPNGVEVVADSLSIPLTVAIRVEADPTEPVVFVRLRLTNFGRETLPLRLVAPKIQGLLPRGNPDGWMGAIPQEIGSVRRVTHLPIGMPYSPSTLDDPSLNAGLPTAMNTMEVASLYDPAGTGGLFFADVDGIAGTQSPPIQFTLSADEVAGFWITNLEPGESRFLPRFAIGVHHDGDWHRAIDFYLRHHDAPQTNDVPAWFRDAGAIYSWSGGGAGGIYLELPGANLIDRSLWTTFERDGAHWNPPVSFTRGGLAPAGAHVAARMRQNTAQEDAFFVGEDGALDTVFQLNDGPWSDPIMLTRPRFASPGCRLAAVSRDDHQEDVFVVGLDGAVYTLFVVDGRWNGPIPLTPRNFAPSGAGVAAVRRNATQEDLFVVDRFGAIHTLFVRFDGVRWGAWSAPIALSARSTAPAGASLAAVGFGEPDVDLFVVSRNGRLLWLSERNDLPWTAPFALTAPNFAPMGAEITAVVRNDHQEDVFTTGIDGAIRTLWTDAARHWFGPAEVAAPGFTIPGASLTAVVRNAHQEDLFVVRSDGSAFTLFERDDSAWQSPTPPDPLTFGGFAPAGGGIAAVERNEHQMDAFLFGQGRLTSFRDLPRILAEARDLGTNIIYLWDYWETSPFAPIPHYFNKGDYIPRRDLGGEPALIDGIREVHRLGGRVILYLEPFIIAKDSILGRTLGADWAGRDPFGRPYEHYGPTTYTMCAPFDTWQAYVAGTAARFVASPDVPPPFPFTFARGYGADGVLLDSWDWQLNWPMGTRGGTFFDAHDFTAGAVSLVQQVRSTVRLFNPEAIVMGETTSGPMGRVWDGGLSADFTHKWWFDKIYWADQMNDGRIAGSPVRYGAPGMNWFSNGHDLNEMNQVWAAGHSLALCSNWPGTFMHDNAATIRRLVNLRRQFRNALIEGRQEYQPATGATNVIAFLYRGTRDVVLTVVNTASEGAFTGDVLLHDSEANSRWRVLVGAAPGRRGDDDDEHEGESAHVHDRTKLRVTVPAGELRAFVER
ncbi:MAG: hypothetical protein HY292_27390 [Planctomycetes bacterium]|nr:hypothetical protein [Planctomycetota bacterium]